MSHEQMLLNNALGIRSFCVTDLQLTTGNIFMQILFQLMSQSYLKTQKLIGKFQGNLFTPYFVHLIGLFSPYLIGIVLRVFSLRGHTVNRNYQCGHLAG